MLRCITFLFAAIALAGCCVSGNGCYAPSPGAPIAWDGLGLAPTKTAHATEYRPRTTTRPKTENIIGPIGDVVAEPNPRPQGKDTWAEQEAADRADEEKLAKKLMICRDCLPAPARDDATGSVTR
jgi:hypothetical protein